MGYDILPELKDYKKYADQKISQINHGGIVAYIHKSLVPHVFDINYYTCFISLRLDFAPSFIFIGMYIQPESSRYFTTDMFSDLSDLLISSNERNLIPVMGGDMNCRFGNLNEAFHENGLVYGENVDMIDNFHGRTYGIDLCKTGNIFPLNHIMYKNRAFEGNFTYYKAGSRSQIDYVYTSKDGMKFVKNFAIITEDWHLSDHLPICLDIRVPEAIQCAFLLKRARDLNYEYDPHKESIKRYLASYDTVKFENNLREIFPSMDRHCRKLLNEGNINDVIHHIELSIDKVYRNSKVIQVANRIEDNIMQEANLNFKNLRKCITDKKDNFDEILQQYQESRNKISKEIFCAENGRWNELIANKDSKKLWEKISWKGDTSNNVFQAPMFEDLTAFFEDLYTNESKDLDKIEGLVTDTYEPALDDPITTEEIDLAMNSMKNGEYDHRIGIFKIMKKIMNPLILLLLNTLFFVAYPIKLAISLLSALPKVGDLSLSTNYRGIQMLPALAVLYDRVIAIRLSAWSRVHDVQSAFQKFKSTLHQLLAVRLLIELAKKENITLYIGLFDLAKAFDKVSRYQLLKKLIIRGIGNCMLQALKRLYMHTYCVLSFGREMSDKFRTFAGIRQGAASSTLLFIGFIDDLVDFLENRCPREPFLDVLHCLLHADDTAIFSTDRQLFVDKCNNMLEYFDENELKLNLSKSAYLIINGKEADYKCPLTLRNGNLDYKSIVKYLGMKISDTGSIKGDVEINIESKRSNLTIKYGNFCRKNFLAPIDVKLHVLNSCVSASLLYGCEVWGMAKVNKVESMYRQGLKTALSIRSCVNNEIVYIETGTMPLETRITQQQLKFWLSIQEIVNTNPTHYISKLVAATEDTGYVRYYKQLQQRYTTIDNCANLLNNNFKSTYESKTREVAESDSDSHLGTYLAINPSLSKPSYDNKLEFQRVIVTRYRTGSHNLRIESGRMLHIPREERLCKCDRDVQTVEHVLLHCHLLDGIREKYNVVDIENGISNVDYLMEMEHILGIK